MIAPLSPRRLPYAVISFERANRRLRRIHRMQAAQRWLERWWTWLLFAIVAAIVFFELGMVTATWYVAVR